MFRDRFRRVNHEFLFRCVLASAILTTAAMAIENKPLPGFEVQTPAGSTVGSDSWKMQGKWVLIYLEGRCAPCMHLLSRLSKDKYPQLASQTIIIVGSVQSSDVRALQKEFPDLAEATWYADPERNVPKALNLHGAPVTLGVQDKVLRWAIGGIPPSLRLLPSVLKKWSAQPGAIPSPVPTIPSTSQ